MSSASGAADLHAIGEFETFDPRGELLLRRIRRELLLIELGQQIELRTLPRVGQFRRAIQVVDRIALRLQPGALIHARQESRAPVVRIALRQPTAQRVADITTNAGRSRLSLPRP